jgi:Protein of unknown function (DUF2948)
MPEPLLRIRAEDKEDLAVIAAAIQDAAFLMGDIAFDPKARRFAISLNRFRWEAAGKRGPFERVRSAFAVETVLGVKSRKVRLGAPDAAGVVLDISFEPGAEAPAGSVVLRLGGGGDIRLDVECIDATLTDMGAPWPTPRRPDHERY